MLRCFLLSGFIFEFFFLMNLENGLAKGFIFFFLIMLINTEFKGNDFVPSSIFFLCL